MALEWLLLAVNSPPPFDVGTISKGNAPGNASAAVVVERRLGDALREHTRFLFKSNSEPAAQFSTLNSKRPTRYLDIREQSSLYILTSDMDLPTISPIAGPLLQVRLLLRRLLAAAQFLHERGIVHRDIKVRLPSFSNFPSISLRVIYALERHEGSPNARVADMSGRV